MTLQKKHILISTGIYPPQIGGPAQYAKNLKNTFENKGYLVVVKKFSFENYLPSGLRHLFFFFKVIPQVLKSDIIFILDTFSVGLPTVLACKIFGKKSVIRTGGDFLWEEYVERTGKKVLLREFYKTEINNFSQKEKIIFSCIKWTLHNVSRIIFSTEWQRDIFIKAYELKIENTFIVENYYGQKDLFEQTEEPLKQANKIFVASTRGLKWKNLDIIKKIFDEIKSQDNSVELFTENLPFVDFMEKIKNSYAVVQVSLGDISPNLILDAIRYNKPFICTEEVGILPRIKDAGAFVNPLNETEIKKAVLNLLNEDEYKKAKEKVEQFSFVHTWENIADEFTEIFDKIK